MMIEHPNIVRLIEVLASKTKIYLVLEYIEGGELWEQIKKNGKIEEDEMRRYFRQIVRALCYCKSKNIAHRDLKPENGQIKVSDFGLSSLYKDKESLTKLLHSTCGTINYLAPEVIQNLGYDGHMADMWSLGVMLFFCLFGYLPFEDYNVGKLLDKIVAADYEIPKNCPKKLKGRLTLSQIIQHPWFLENITEEESGWFAENFEKEITSPKKYIAINFDSDFIEEVNSPIKIKSSKELQNTLNPKKINAFELMNFLSGSVINRIFDLDINFEFYQNKKEDQKIYYQFTMRKDITEIVELIFLAFKFCKAKDAKLVDPDQGVNVIICYSNTLID